MDFYELKWFETKDELIEWLAEQTRMNFYLKEVWDVATKTKAPLRIKYQLCLHHYVGVEVFHCNKKIAYIRQNPYGSNEKWIIERKTDNGIL